MVDLPPEIWLRIASFVPNEKLCHLLAVNKVFFDVAMGLRWTDVLIVTRNTSEAMHILQRLRDPFVARRLRRLVIRLSHAKERHSGESQENSSRDFRRLRQQFHLTINRVFKIFRREAGARHGEGNGGGGDAHTSPGMIGSSSDLKRQHRPMSSQVIDAIVEAAPQFVNVDDLRIDSWDFPPSYDLKSLFVAFWAAFGQNLRCLSLGGNLEGYRVLIESQPKLDKLTELWVEFTNNLFRVDRDADAMTLVDNVAPFINSLNPHLKTLRIWSWASLDLSAFFDKLAVLPKLEYLNIRMAYNKALSDPSGLTTLLTECSETMQKLDLRLNPSGLPLNPVWEEPLSRWLLQCIDDPRCFANLRSLDIYPTNVPAGIDILTSCIQRMSGTIQHLILRDRYLHLPEAVRVIDALSACRNLVYLRLNVWKVEVVLFDILAEKVPWLEQIWISVGETLTSAEHVDPLALPGQNNHSNFYQDLATRHYTDWKLKDISVWQGGQEVDRDTMLALGRSIPSVNSFFETGRMDLPL